MQDLVARCARMREEMAEERAVGLVAVRALGGADEIEFTLERGRPEQVVVDVGNDRELVFARERVQRRLHVGIELESRKCVEVARDQPTVAAQAEMRERLLEREPADL